MATDRRVVALFFFVTLISSLSSFGQMINNAGGRADFNCWSSLSLDAISAKGKFVAFRVQYQDRNDTLFVKDVTNGGSQVFPAGNGAAFASEKYFACNSRPYGVSVMDLRNKKRLMFPLAESFSFTADGNTIALFTPGLDLGSLLIRNLESGSEQQFESVSEWSLDPLGKSFAVAEADNLWLISTGIKLQKKNLVAVPSGKFSDIEWDKNGSSFAFSTKGSEKKLYHYSINAVKLSSISETLYGPIRISSDKKYLYFGRLKPLFQKEEATSPAEVWNTADLHIFPERKQLGDPSSYPEMAVWEINTGKVVAIGDVGPSYLFTPAGLIFTQFSEIGDQSSMYQPRDFYVADPVSGERHLWLRSHSSSLDRLAIDHEGRYVAYEKEDEIFAYDFIGKEHLPIGSGSLLDWSEKNGKLQFFLDGGVWETLPGEKSKKVAFTETKDVVLRPYAGDIFEAESRDGSLAGYYGRNGKGRIYPLAFGEFHASQLLMAEDGTACAYVRQRFDSPPEIIYSTMEGETPVSIVRSNFHFKKEQWGRAERISYTGPQGSMLSGVLIYPANYDPTKRYPMVLNIYEAQARHLHLFSSPSLRNYAGFNASILANSGYFVLRPDIAFGKEEFFTSTVACVRAAVQEACRVAAIDPKRIGLIGHSFGGTQASLLAAKTDIFATVIAGAGNSNLTSRYLSWSANNRRTEYWRFESGQNFMGGKTLFEDMDSYVKNSSALMAQSITVPMLIWTGSDDRQVPPVDSEALYLALRRLGKKGIMLKYEREEHALIGTRAQEDLTLKVMDWFGHYLKGEDSKYWMQPNRE